MQRGESSKNIQTGYTLWVKVNMVRLTLTEREFLPDVSYDGVPARPIPRSIKALCTFRTAFNNLKRSFLVHNSAISVVYAA